MVAELLAWYKEMKIESGALKTVMNRFLNSEHILARFKRRATSELETRAKLVRSRLGLSDWYMTVYNRLCGFYTTAERVIIFYYAFYTVV